MKPHSKSKATKFALDLIVNTEKREIEFIPLTERSHDPVDYVEIKASEVKPDQWFYRRSEDGKRFERFMIDTMEIKNSDVLAQLLRYWTKIFASQGRLYRKR